MSKKRSEEIEKRNRGLSRRIRSGDLNAAWELAMLYRGLAARQVCSYLHIAYGADKDDLMQQAFIGLLETAFRFDPDRAPFDKAARYGIRHSILRYLIDCCNEIRVPVKSRDRLLQMRKGRTLSEKDERAAKRAQKILDAEFFSVHVSRIPARGTDRGRRHETDALNLLIREERAALVRKQLAALNPRERFVLEGIFFEDMSYEEIGLQLFRKGLTDKPVPKGSVNQYRFRAMNKLRRAMSAA